MQARVCDIQILKKQFVITNAGRFNIYSVSVTKHNEMSCGISKVKCEIPLQINPEKVKSNINKIDEIFDIIFTKNLRSEEDYLKNGTRFVK